MLDFTVKPKDLKYLIDIKHHKFWGKMKDFKLGKLETIALQVTIISIVCLILTKLYLTYMILTVLFLVLNNAFLPLFSKISTENIFENETRRKIYSATEDKYVISLNDLRKQLKMPRATLEWHLFVLERAGYISTIKFLNKRYVYRSVHEERAILHLLRGSKKIKPMIECLAFNGKVRIPEILIDLNVSFENIRDLVVRLSRMNLIYYELRRDGVIYVTDRGKLWFKKVLDTNILN